MVGALLTVLTVAVLQLGLALLVRNTLIDAAAEGAHIAALADNTLGDGEQRARELIGSALGDGYTNGVTAAYGTYRGTRSVVITVRAPLPMAGLLGPRRALEVSGHAPVESLH
ncbi:hypothetical protein GCM10028798_20230 [Humibacter antri]